jgi:hypothetical protein
MDAQIENHLPLITHRIVFAAKVFLPPPTITSRMEFPSINVEQRDDSPAPEDKHLRASISGRARTPTPRRTGTAREVTNPKWARPLENINTVVAFDQDEDLSSLSPLSEKSDYDIDEYEETSAIRADREVRPVRGEGMIPKPKGEVGRPGAGGYTLFKALDWNQKTYDNIHVSKCGEHMKNVFLTKSPITRHSS